MNRITFWLKKRYWSRFPKDSEPLGGSIFRWKRILCWIFGHKEEGVYSWISKCRRCYRSFDPVPYTRTHEEAEADNDDYWGSYGIRSEEEVMGLIVEE